MTMFRSAILSAFLAAGSAAAGVGTSSTIPAVPFPDFRFTAWSDLDTSIRDHAHNVGYHAKTWDKPGSLEEVEGVDFETLQTDSNAAYDDMVAMGFSAAQWDCYVNHYKSYGWKELQNAEANAESGTGPLVSYKALGWTHQSWDEDIEAPPSDGKYWDDLSEEEQAAAKSLCYDQFLWDGVAIPLWTDDDGSGGSSVSDEEEQEGNGASKGDEAVEEKQDVYEELYNAKDRDHGEPVGPGTAHNSRDIPVPKFRYDTFDSLNGDQQELAFSAQYDEKTWNSFSKRDEDLEGMDFETIGEKDEDAQTALKELGFSEEQWDCYISHYRTYDWEELKDAGVQQYYKALGWTHKAWDDYADAPDTEGVYWPDLTQEQQEAAYELCYFRETWDEVSIQFWPRTSSNSKFDYMTKYAKTHPAIIGVGAFLGWSFLLTFCVVGYYCFCRPRSAASKGIDIEMDSTFGGSGYRDEPIEGRQDEEYQGDEEEYQGDEEEYGERPTIL